MSIVQAVLQQVRSKVLAATSADVITSSRLAGTVDTVATGPCARLTHVHPRHRPCEHEHAFCIDVAVAVRLRR